jgi:ubiquitin-protein ligase
MTAQSDQLSEIFSRITEEFSSHEYISVQPVKGDPPDKYEIIYILPGMVQEDGEIVLAKKHVVECSIPFGYPHFPPSCKPKTPIFHPDFDPAAICLGDFWELNRSLPELIIHIGRMICGEFYSADNAFNEEAALWFAENKDKLPFSTVLSGKSTRTPFSQPVPAEIDTLDDSDLTTDHDYLSIEPSDIKEQEEELIPEKLPAMEEEIGSEIDFTLIQLLDKQNRYSQLFNLLSDLPPSTRQEAEPFFSNAKKAINIAKKFHNKARSEEDRGNGETALKLYEKIPETVSDFPDISVDIDRLKRSIELLKELSPETSPQPPQPPATEPKKEKPEKPGPFSNRKKAAQKTSPRLPRSPKIKFAVGFGVILILAGCAGYYYFTLQQNINFARKSFASCKTALKADNFNNAKQSCDQALMLVNQIKFINQPEMAVLKSEIHNTLQSEKMRMGLTGKILFDGQYLAKKDVKALLFFRQLKDDAFSLYDQQKWAEAAAKLHETISVARNTPSLDSHILPILLSRLQHAKLLTFLNDARKKQKEHSWKAAIKHYTNALTYLNELPQEMQQQYRGQLLQGLEKSRFEDLKSKGDSLFAESDWEKATSFYQKAIQLAEKKGVVPKETLDKIAVHAQKAKLYDTIKRGNLAFSAGSWQKAIDAYKKAEMLLSRDKDILLSGSDVNVKKLERISLQASIIKERQAAKKLLEKNNLSAARETYNNVITVIQHSSLAEDPEFQEIAKETKGMVQSLDQEIFLKQKQNYLETNFKKLFAQNYASTIPEKLSNPTVTFIKETPAKLLFKLQCLEKSGNRPLALIMFYAYDKKKKTWDFSPGDL